MWWPGWTCAATRWGVLTRILWWPCPSSTYKQNKNKHDCAWKCTEQDSHKIKLWRTKIPIDWLIEWMNGQFDWVIDWLIECAFDWLLDWLIDWLIDQNITNHLKILFSGDEREFVSPGVLKWRFRGRSALLRRGSSFKLRWRRCATDADDSRSSTSLSSPSATFSTNFTFPAININSAESKSVAGTLEDVIRDRRTIPPLPSATVTAASSGLISSPGIVVDETGSPSGWSWSLVVVVVAFSSAMEARNSPLVRLTILLRLPSCSCSRE